MIDRDIQIGDIRVCSNSAFGLKKGDLLEIIGEHPEIKDHWYLRYYPTGEMWVYDNDPEYSALNTRYLEELIGRVNDPYEVCE